MKEKKKRVFEEDGRVKTGDNLKVFSFSFFVSEERRVVAFV